MELCQSTSTAHELVLLLGCQVSACLAGGQLLAPLLMRPAVLQDRLGAKALAHAAHSLEFDKVSAQLVCMEPRFLCWPPLAGLRGLWSHTCCQPRGQVDCAQAFMHALLSRPNTQPTSRALSSSRRKLLAACAGQLPLHARQPGAA